jgi:hypothetical protein
MHDNNGGQSSPEKGTSIRGSSGWRRNSRIRDYHEMQKDVLIYLCAPFEGSPSGKHKHSD